MPLYVRFAIVLLALGLASFGIAASGAAQGRPAAPPTVPTQS